MLAAARLDCRILFSNQGSWFKVRLPSQNFKRKPKMAKPSIALSELLKRG